MTYFRENVGFCQDVIVVSCVLGIMIALLLIIIQEEKT